MIHTVASNTKCMYMGIKWACLNPSSPDKYMDTVSSWNGGRRLGTVDRPESRAAPEYSWSRGTEKDRLWYGAY
ncbi:hypothetical protein PR003_g28171 [Phytophthora rubi]|uniref:Uncharacterized protein n=1 Tax=Phytophthora rubi TaxID=129364 RepID=A0A6A4BVZ4_9STRA|nr:hypothetical protein PR002_g27277 [Phytophthora rubi]KAE9279663.1 hypothetical protein PR003_g28171 [Phytophthora rubi]